MNSLDQHHSRNNNISSTTQMKCNTNSNGFTPTINSLSCATTIQPYNISSTPFPTPPPSSSPVSSLSPPLLSYNSGINDTLFDERETSSLSNQSYPPPTLSRTSQSACTSPSTTAKPKAKRKKKEKLEGKEGQERTVGKVKKASVKASVGTLTSRLPSSGVNFVNVARVVEEVIKGDSADRDEIDNTQDDFFVPHDYELEKKQIIKEKNKKKRKEKKLKKEMAIKQEKDKDVDNKVKIKENEMMDEKKEKMKEKKKRKKKDVKPIVPKYVFAKHKSNKNGQTSSTAAGVGSSAAGAQSKTDPLVDDLDVNLDYLNFGVIPDPYADDDIFNYHVWQSSDDEEDGYGGARNQWQQHHWKTKWQSILSDSENMSELTLDDLLASEHDDVNHLHDSLTGWMKDKVKDEDIDEMIANHNHKGKRMQLSPLNGYNDLIPTLTTSLTPRLCDLDTSIAGHAHGHGHPSTNNNKLKSELNAHKWLLKNLIESKQKDLKCELSATLQLVTQLKQPNSFMNVNTHYYLDKKLAERGRRVSAKGVTSASIRKGICCYDASSSSDHEDENETTYSNSNSSHSNENSQSDSLSRSTRTRLSRSCSRPSLPFSRHCLTHILYNVDQLLFSRCTAKCPPNTIVPLNSSSSSAVTSSKSHHLPLVLSQQCSAPTFDITHEEHEPLCVFHQTLEAQSIAAADAASFNHLSDSTFNCSVSNNEKTEKNCNSRKRKRNKPMALTRSTARARNRKRKKGNSKNESQTELSQQSIHDKSNEPQHRHDIDGDCDGDGDDVFDEVSMSSDVHGMSVECSLSEMEMNVLPMVNNDRDDRDTTDDDSVVDEIQTRSKAKGKGKKQSGSANVSATTRTRSSGKSGKSGKGKGKGKVIPSSTSTIVTRQSSVNHLQNQMNKNQHENMISQPAIDNHPLEPQPLTSSISVCQSITSTSTNPNGSISSSTTAIAKSASSSTSIASRQNPSETTLISLRQIHPSVQQVIPNQHQIEQQQQHAIRDSHLNGHAHAHDQVMIGHHASIGVNHQMHPSNETTQHNSHLTNGLILNHHNPSSSSFYNNNDITNIAHPSHIYSLSNSSRSTTTTASASTSAHSQHSLSSRTHSHLERTLTSNSHTSPSGSSGSISSSSPVGSSSNHEHVMDNNSVMCDAMHAPPPLEPSEEALVASVIANLPNDLPDTDFSEVLNRIPDDFKDLLMDAHNGDDMMLPSVEETEALEAALAMVNKDVQNMVAAAGIDKICDNNNMYNINFAAAMANGFDLELITEQIERYEKLNNNNCINSIASPSPSSSLSLPIPSCNSNNNNLNNLHVNHRAHHGGLHPLHQQQQQQHQIVVTTTTNNTSLANTNLANSNYLNHNHLTQHTNNHINLVGHHLNGVNASLNAVVVAPISSTSPSTITSNGLSNACVNAGNVAANGSSMIVNAHSMIANDVDVK